ncbi:hypothetical protein D9613_000465 [Agrocybe pediades]|uniref:BAG domain-containing protein n=1 Tax=Agrocybe pediades TaxID=84607 RepID=A0A8H4R2I9_9AGAR|nr:hypothetical protein D9613_000465 [Agrocybe pediades]
MPVTVRWGNHRFEFELPPPDTTLAAIRQSIAAYTQLGLHDFQIVHDGAVMADDNATSMYFVQLLSAYHLRPNSSIAIVANADLPAPFKNSEQAQIATIRAELDAARTRLLPLQQQFLRDLHACPTTKKHLAKDHTRIGELLLQALLRLDAIAPEQDWATARADRKAAVKELQSLLDQLDSEWAAAA